MKILLLALMGTGLISSSCSKQNTTTTFIEQYKQDWVRGMSGAQYVQLDKCLDKSNVMTKEKARSLLSKIHDPYYKFLGNLRFSRYLLKQEEALEALEHMIVAETIYYSEMEADNDGLWNPLFLIKSDFLNLISQMNDSQLKDRYLSLHRKLIILIPSIERRILPEFELAIVEKSLTQEELTNTVSTLTSPSLKARILVRTGQYYSLFDKDIDMAKECVSEIDETIRLIHNVDMKYDTKLIVNNWLVSIGLEKKY